MKGKTIRKIILRTLAILALLAGVLLIVGYFSHSKLIRSYAAKTVNRESKGVYKLEIGGLNLNILSGNLTVRDFALMPDTARYRSLLDDGTDTLGPMLIQLKINQFKFTGLRIMDLVLKRRLDLSRLLFAELDVTVYRMYLPPKDTAEKEKAKMLSLPLPKGISSIELKELAIEKATLEFIDCSSDTISRTLLPESSILITHILVDSAHQGKHRLFNADDISITLSKYSIKTKNGMNSISFGEIGLSTASGLIYVRDLQLEPLYGLEEYGQKNGFQTDRIEIAIPNIWIRRLNFRKLFENKLQAGLLEIDTLHFEAYRDKRIPREPGYKPPMPQDAIRNLKTYLRIDTVLLKGGKATYSEQVGDVPGTLFFDQLSGTFTGLTNDSILLNEGLVSELNGTAYLMGKGKLDATIRFRFGDQRNSFTFSALMGPMDLQEINPMLSNLLPVKVESGRLRRLVVPEVMANDDQATGNLQFYYNDLSIGVVDEKETTWSKVKKGVLDFVANDLVLNNDNPTASGKMKTGVIHFTRDKDKGIINFLWKSVLSGLKSTVGYNSKTQKAILQEEREYIKAREQKDKKKGK